MSESTPTKMLDSSGTIVPSFPPVPENATIAQRLQAVLAWYQASRVGRTVATASNKGIPVMAAGMAYMGLFSVFAGLWAAFSIAGFILAGRPDVIDWLVGVVENAVPGLVGDGAAIDPAMLLNATVFGWTGVISLLATIWTALNWLGGARIAIRTVFDLPPASPIPFVLAKLRDFGLVLGAVALVALSSVFVAAGSGAVTAVLGTFGIGGDWVVRQFLIEAGGFLVAAAVDALLIVGMVRVLSHVIVPRRILLPSAALGGVALTTIKLLATALVGGATANPLVATFAALFSVLILFNLMATVQLYIAAWMKTSMDDNGLSPRVLTAEEAATEAEGAELRARREVLAAEELRLREQLRGEPRFRRRRLTRRLREVEQERLALEREDLERRMGVAGPSAQA